MLTFLDLGGAHLLLYEVQMSGNTAVSVTISTDG